MSKKQVKEKREALLPIWVTDSRHNITKDYHLPQEVEPAERIEGWAVLALEGTEALQRLNY
jgi:hypothetical protein